MSAWDPDSNQIKIIPNEFGDTILPSVIYIHKETKEVSIGKEKYLSSPLSEYAVFSGIKRLIGYKWYDPNLQAELSQVPFPVVCGGNNQTQDQVFIETPLGLKTPIEMSSMVLAKIKSMVEAYYSSLDSKGGVKPEVHAVVTVPAYFNDSQRLSTKRAAELAGLYVIRMINEPTAASLAYGFRTPINTSKTNETTLVVIDIGSGTTDITLLTLTNDYTFDIQATSGDTRLGGKDIDFLLYTFFTEKVFTPKQKSEIAQSEKKKRKLVRACDIAKCTLSSTNSVQLNIECLFSESNPDWSYQLTRSKFENIAAPFFKRLVDPLDQIFGSENKIKGSQHHCYDRSLIDCILLVGGSSRIPKVHYLVETYFGKPVTITDHSDFAYSPDHAIAYGAGIQATVLADSDQFQKYTQDHPTLSQILLSDIIPLSIGIETEGGLMNIILPRNTKIPTCKHKTFVPAIGGELSVVSNVDVSVYEGERRLAKYNHFLGEFLFPLKTQQKRIHVEFNVDENGLLVVIVTEDETRNTLRRTIKPTIQMSKSSAGINIDQNEMFYKYDQLVAENVQERLRLEVLCKQTIQNGIYNGAFDEEEDEFCPTSKKTRLQLLETLEMLHQYSNDDDTGNQNNISDREFTEKYVHVTDELINEIQMETLEFQSLYTSLHSTINRLYAKREAYTGDAKGNFETKLTKE